MDGMTDNQTVALTIFLTITAVGVLTLIAVYLMVGMAWQDYDTSADSPRLDRRHHARAQGRFSFARSRGNVRIAVAAKSSSRIFR